MNHLFFLFYNLKKLNLHSDKMLIIIETDAVTQGDAAFEAFLIMSGSADILFDNPDFFNQDVHNEKEDSAQSGNLIHRFFVFVH